VDIEIINCVKKTGKLYNTSRKWRRRDARIQSAAAAAAARRSVMTGGGGGGAHVYSRTGFTSDFSISARLL